MKRIANALTRYPFITAYGHLDGEDLDMEIVAQFVAEKLMGDERTMCQIVQREGKTFGQKLHDLWNALVAKIKSVFGVKTDTDVQRQLDMIERGRALLADVVRSADVGEGEGKVRSSYSGERAKTANITKLSEAQRMESEGADSESIRKTTGWHKGYDGKWRFEIDDSGMKISTSGRFTRDAETRRYIELLHKVYFEGDTTATEAEMNELRTLDEKFRDKSIMPNKLGDLIEHEDLFAAYPELTEVWVYFSKETEDTSSYHPGFNEIVLPFSYKLQPKKLKEALLHEIQHAVQEIEGFSMGSNPREAGNYENYRKTVGEIEARDSASRANLDAEQRKNTRPDIDRTDVIFTDGGESYSIGETEDGIPVVVVRDDVLKGLKSIKEKRAAVKDALRKFKAIPIHKQNIIINKDTRGEITWSEYSQYLEREKPGILDDKFRAAAHPDEIIYATTDYINEEPSHDRDDNIVDFARGKILLEVHGRKYEAEVLFGYTTGNICELYDIVNMNPKHFSVKKESASYIVHSQNAKFDRQETLHNNSISNPDENVKGDSKIRFSFAEDGDAPKMPNGEDMPSSNDVRISPFESNVIFDYVVRAGKARFGDVFYDINLEVASYLPRADSTSDIYMATSNDNRIAQNEPAVKSKDMQKAEKDAAKMSFSFSEDGDTPKMPNGENMPSSNDIRISPFESAEKMLRGGMQWSEVQKQTKLTMRQIALQMQANGASAEDVRALTGLYQDELGTWLFDEKWLGENVPDLEANRAAQLAAAKSAFDPARAGITPAELDRAYRTIKKIGEGARKIIRPSADEFAGDYALTAAQNAIDLVRREKETITFAAPVVLNGVRGNMAVVVNKRSNYYIAHRIVLPDGRSFVFDDNKNDATQGSSRGVTVSSSLAETTSVASANSIPNPDENVKGDSKTRFSFSEDGDTPKMPGTL